MDELKIAAVKAQMSADIYCWRVMNLAIRKHLRELDRVMLWPQYRSDVTKWHKAREVGHGSEEA